MKLSDRVNFANIYWPGQIKKVTQIYFNNEIWRTPPYLYQVSFEDGTEFDLVPEFWIRNRVICMDIFINECPLKAKKGICSRNEFLLIFCRKSCGICTSPPSTDPIQTAGSENDEKRVDNQKNGFDEKVEEIGDDIEIIPSQFEFLVDSFREYVPGFEKISKSFESNSKRGVNEKSKMGMGKGQANGEASTCEALKKIAMELIISGNSSLAMSFLHRCTLMEGDPESQFILGHLYSLQENVPKSLLYFYFASSGLNNPVFNENDRKGGLKEIDPQGVIGVDSSTKLSNINGINLNTNIHENENEKTGDGMSIHIRGCFCDYLRWRINKIMLWPISHLEIYMHVPGHLI